jgi:hypothetical protein
VGATSAAHRTRDDAQPLPVDVVACRQQVEAAGEPGDLRLDLGGVGGRAARLDPPREPSLGQKADGSQRGQLPGLVEELVAVPVGRLGVEPVPHDESRPAAGRWVRGADEPGLHAIRAASAVDDVVGHGVHEVRVRPESAAGSRVETTHLTYGYWYPCGMRQPDPARHD